MNKLVIFLVLTLIPAFTSYEMNGHVLVLGASDFEEAKEEFDYLFVKW